MSEWRTRSMFSPAVGVGGKPTGDPADLTIAARFSMLPQELPSTTSPELLGKYVAARGEVRSILDEYGGDDGAWPAGHRERATRMVGRAEKLAGEMRAEWQGQMQRVMDNLDDPEFRARHTESITDPNVVGDASSRDDWSTRTRPAEGGDVYSRARRNIDDASRAGMLPDYAAERATRLLEHGTDEARSVAARWAAAAGSPSYLRAFTKLVADPQRGHMTWTGDEQAAYREATHVRAAMTIGTGAGGELVPLTLDPSIILTNAGSINPLRRIARTVQTATSNFTGVTSSGAVSEWKAEGVEAADGSPPVAALEIPVHASVTNVTFSYELQQDATSLVNELSRVMRDSIDNLHNVAFATGTGTGEPAGLITGGTATNTGGAFSAANVYALQAALPPRFSERAQWAGPIAVINAMRQFETTNGNRHFPELADGRLLGKPFNELSNISADMTTLNSKFLAYFDPQEFVIVDHVGSLFELLPGYGANRRPTGQRHALLFSRTGSKVAVATAARFLNKT